jgi:hypothetical protein
MSRSFTAGAPTGRVGLLEVNQLCKVATCQVATVVHSWMRTDAVLSSNSFSSRSASSFHTCQGTQKHSAALSSTQQHSEALRGTQRHSEALRGTQRHSEALSCHQRRSEAIRGDQWPSDPPPVAISGSISGAIRGAKWPSVASRFHTSLSAFASILSCAEQLDKTIGSQASWRCMHTSVIR